jgi:hypothetical protein
MLATVTVLFSSCGLLIKHDATRGAAKFELREVGCTEQIHERSWEYRCRATLLTRDNRYQEGNFIVWVKDTTRDPDGKLRYPEVLPYYVVLSGKFWGFLG